MRQAVLKSLRTTALTCAGFALVLPGCEGRLTLGDAPIGLDASTAETDATRADDSIETDGEIVVEDAVADDHNANNCIADAGCGLPTLHCDSRNGSCVACLNDTHCPKALRRCDQALHRCVECGVDLDCRADELCEPLSRRCVRRCGDGGSCPADAPRCDTTRGFCIRCAADSDCDKKRCDVASGTCVECIDDMVCPKDRPRCDVILGRCLQCVAADDCPTTKPLCDPAMGACIAK